MKKSFARIRSRVQKCVRSDNCAGIYIAAQLSRQNINSRCAIDYLLHTAQDNNDLLPELCANREIFLIGKKEILSRVKE